MVGGLHLKRADNIKKSEQSKIRVTFVYERALVHARVLPLGTRKHIKRIQAIRPSKRVALRIGSKGARHSSVVEFGVGQTLAHFQFYTRLSSIATCILN